MNIVQLRHFALVVETGSFAAAADQANITQPAMSNSIRVLEERIGVQLLDRTTRPIRLTGGGRELMERAKILLAEARNLDKAIAHIANGEGGHLRFGLTGVSSASLGGRILGHWTSEDASRSVDVIVAGTTTLLDMLCGEKLDAVIGDARDMPAVSSEFDMTPLPALPGGAFCRAGHPLLARTQLDASDLLSFQFAGPHLSTPVVDLLVRNLGAQRRADLKFAVDSDNLSLLRDATINSDLILLTTRSSVQNAIRAGLIEQLPVEIDIKATWAYATLRNSVPHPALSSLKHSVETVAKRVADKG